MLTMASVHAWALAPQVGRAGDTAQMDNPTSP